MQKAKNMSEQKDAQLAARLAAKDRYKEKRRRRKAAKKGAGVKAAVATAQAALAPLGNNAGASVALDYADRVDDDFTSNLLHESEPFLFLVNSETGEGLLCEYIRNVGWGDPGNYKQMHLSKEDVALLKKTTGIVPDYLNIRLDMRDRPEGILGNLATLTVLKMLNLFERVNADPTDQRDMLRRFVEDRTGRTVSVNISDKTAGTRDRTKVAVRSEPSTKEERLFRESFDKMLAARRDGAQIAIGFTNKDIYKARRWENRNGGFLDRTYKGSIREGTVVMKTITDQLYGGNSVSQTIILDRTEGTFLPGYNPTQSWEFVNLKPLQGYAVNPDDITLVNNLSDARTMFELIFRIVPEGLKAFVDYMDTYKERQTRLLQEAKVARKEAAAERVAMDKKREVFLSTLKSKTSVVQDVASKAEQIAEEYKWKVQLATVKSRVSMDDQFIPEEADAASIFGSTEQPSYVEKGALVLAVKQVLDGVYYTKFVVLDRRACAVTDAFAKAYSALAVPRDGDSAEPLEDDAKGWFARLGEALGLDRSAPLREVKSFDDILLLRTPTENLDFIDVQQAENPKSLLVLKTSTAEFEEYNDVMNPEESSVFCGASESFKGHLDGIAYANFVLDEIAALSQKTMAEQEAKRAESAREQAALKKRNEEATRERGRQKDKYVTEVVEPYRKEFDELVESTWTSTYDDEIFPKIATALEGASIWDKSKLNSRFVSTDGTLTEGAVILLVDQLDKTYYEAVLIDQSQTDIYLSAARNAIKNLPNGPKFIVNKDKVIIRTNERGYSGTDPGSIKLEGLKVWREQVEKRVGTTTTAAPAAAAEEKKKEEEKPLSFFSSAAEAKRQAAAEAAKQEEKKVEEEVQEGVGEEKDQEETKRAEAELEAAEQERVAAAEVAERERVAEEQEKQAAAEQAAAKAEEGAAEKRAAEEKQAADEAAEQEKTKRSERFQALSERSEESGYHLGILNYETKIKLEEAPGFGGQPGVYTDVGTLPKGTIVLCVGKKDDKLCKMRLIDPREGKRPKTTKVGDNLLDDHFERTGSKRLLRTLPFYADKTGTIAGTGFGTGYTYISHDVTEETFFDEMGSVSDKALKRWEKVLNAPEPKIKEEDEDGGGESKTESKPAFLTGDFVKLEGEDLTLKIRRQAPSGGWLLNKLNNQQYKTNKPYPEDQLTKVKDLTSETSGDKPPVVNGETFNYRFNKTDFETGAVSGMFLKLVGKNGESAVFEDEKGKKYEIELVPYKNFREKISIFNEDESDQRTNKWNIPPERLMRQLIAQKQEKVPLKRKRSKRKKKKR